MYTHTHKFLLIPLLFLTTELRASMIDATFTTTLDLASGNDDFNLDGELVTITASFESTAVWQNILGSAGVVASSHNIHVGGVDYTDPLGFVFFATNTTNRGFFDITGNVLNSGPLLEVRMQITPMDSTPIAEKIGQTIAISDFAFTTFNPVSSNRYEITDATPLTSKSTYDWDFGGASTLTAVLNTGTVPEPSGIVLAMIGVGGLGLIYRRRVGKN